MRTEEEANRAIEIYADMVKRICFLNLKNYVDTEDIFQTVFMKYVLYSGVFESEEHEKSWIIQVTMNACKDLLKCFYRKNIVLTDYIEENTAIQAEYDGYEKERNSHVMEAVLSLPDKYKKVIYLFYYEGYTAAQIGKILNKNENTVYTHLSRGKKMLKEILGGEVIG